jgi:hypothetical protein
MILSDLSALLLPLPAPGVCAKTLLAYSHWHAGFSGLTLAGA